MATDPPSQRAYRAACPNCGAPVEFRSPASAFAVCSYCNSTIVRDGESLRKIGQSAELFDDHTPLQLGAAGKYQGAPFTLVGRVQYRYADGTWNEWHALFDGKSGWLSEDNGRYVFAFDATIDPVATVSLPTYDQLRPGAQYIVNGQSWSVASVTPTKIIAAQGELPNKPNLERGFVVSDLRSTRGEVGTLDYSDPAKPRWSVGHSVGIAELAMTGLADGSSGGGGERTLKGRSLQCPNCGTALEVKLSTTQSVVCHQCHSVIDLTSAAQGNVGGDLRSTRGEVGTLDYSDPAKPRWSVGRSVGIAELAMTGLADGRSGGGGGGERTLKGRSLQCPNCGTALEVKLSTTQSVVCHQCHSVIDLTSAAQGNVGGDLQFYTQQNGMEPQLPLGSTGTLTFGAKVAVPWQVVGYVERCEVPESDDDERSFWREYLLFNRTEGFAFLVDAEDGWSWTIPITGVPQGSGDTVKYEGASYRKLYDYVGQITYVLGEFYWQLTRDQRTANTDYQSGTKKLNRERTTTGAGADATQEIVWSAGEAMPADAIVKAFRLAPETTAALQRDAAPTALKGSLVAKIIFWAVIIIVLLLLFRCGSGGGGSSDCSDTLNTFGQASQEYQNCLNSQRSGGGGVIPYRSGGGSFGGFSSGGGGHK